MKLSEALREGCKLRPRVGLLGERFSHVENRGLCSDLWGAACEAVQPAVARFNWNPLDAYKFECSMDALRAVQLQYFAAYFQMPARCPGSRRKLIKVGGRVINRYGRPQELKTYDDYAKVVNIGGITTECDKVEHLAGIVDHLYHKHRMTAEEVIKCVELYEDAREHGIPQQIAVNQNFNHYQLDGR